MLSHRHRSAWQLAALAGAAILLTWWLADQSRRRRAGGVGRYLLGLPRQAVLRLLGPPRAAASPTQPFAPGASRAFGSDTWYYPLDENARRALAVRFRRGRARSVEVISGPPDPPPPIPPAPPA